MEVTLQKCSLEEHGEENAISYCQECKIYMCKNCYDYHSKLFKKHNQFKLDNESDIKEIFTGLCKENNHSIELEYYCKNHNILCCAKCISKIKDKGFGQHSECDICFIEDFEEEKKNKMNENINILEDLIKILNESIINLKKTLNNIQDNKEKLKIDIQKIFTKIRCAINDREEQLLKELDIKNNYSIINEEGIKKIEKLENVSKTLLNKVKSSEYNWKKNKLNFLINDCINI